MAGSGTPIREAWGSQGCQSCSLKDTYRLDSVIHEQASLHPGRVQLGPCTLEQSHTGGYLTFSQCSFLLMNSPFHELPCSFQPFGKAGRADMQAGLSSLRHGEGQWLSQGHTATLTQSRNWNPEQGMTSTAFPWLPHRNQHKPRHPMCEAGFPQTQTRSGDFSANCIMKVLTFNHFFT